VEELCAALAKPLTMLYFEHPGRQDAIAILYASDHFKLLSSESMIHKGAVTPRIDLRQHTTGLTVRVVAVHQWAPKVARHAGHMEAILDLACRDKDSVHCTILAGDLNEDPHTSTHAAQKRLVQEFKSVDRQTCNLASISNVSKRKMDWIWVQGAEPQYDDICRQVISLSHKACPETGKWPSDHGMVAMRCVTPCLEPEDGCKVEARAEALVDGPEMKIEMEKESKPPLLLDSQGAGPSDAQAPLSPRGAQSKQERDAGRSEKCLEPDEPSPIAKSECPALAEAPSFCLSLEELKDRTVCSSEASILPQAADLCLSLEELTDKSVWRCKALDASKREQYLPDDAFQVLFGMSKVEFSKMPKWRQDLKKKEHELF